MGRIRFRKWAQDGVLRLPSDPSIFLLQAPRGIDMGLAKERCFRPPPAPVALGGTGVVRRMRNGADEVKWSGLERIRSKILTPSPL